VNDLRGFIEYAKTHPVNYASAGVGSFGHLSTELLASRAGVKMTHVPYKGQSPTLNAVLAGEVQLLVTSPSGAMNEYIANKRLKLLAVTSPEPSPLAPGAPTVASVLPGYAAESWFAIVGPPGMPADVVHRLNDAINRVLRMPDVQHAFTGFSLTARTATPKALNDMTAAEVARWKAVIRENNIRAD
jgi:tripartite-type tricarboxylate transporter receptor subunit TctC